MLRQRSFLLGIPNLLSAIFPFPISSHPAGAHAMPWDNRTIIAGPQTGHSTVAGETNTDRTIYNAVALFCAIVLAAFLGFRAKVLRHNVLCKRKFASVLVLILFIFGLAFVVCASIVQTGQGLRTHELCYSAIMICLVFYTSNKLTIYIFFLERVRIVRAPFMPRLKDHVWLAGMFIIVGGFGSIAIVGYTSPVVELSKLDGRCRIGLPTKVSFSLLFFDVVVNLILTVVFFWLLRPVLEFRGLLTTRNWFRKENSITRKINRRLREREEQLKHPYSLSTTGTHEGASLQSAMNKNIKTLLWKCLIGSFLVMFPTVGNMAQFYIMKSRELGWVCLTICTLDVSWGVLVINWLTIGSAQAEANLTTLVSQRDTRSSRYHFSPNLRSKSESEHDVGLTFTASERGSGRSSEPGEELPVFGKTTSLKDDGGLLGENSASGIYSMFDETTVQTPEKSWKG